jgi:hypothetical protein
MVLFSIDKTDYSRKDKKHVITKEESVVQVVSQFKAELYRQHH